MPSAREREKLAATLLVNIDVDDLPRAEAFYKAAFDLTAGRRFGAGGVELLGSSAPIYLLAKPSGSLPAPAISSGRDYARHWTPVHLDFVVEDIDAAIRQALAAGARLEAPVKDSVWGKLALMADPFGHGFCLVQFHNRGYDEIATGPDQA
jgi:predicted enzyme related to lactoylglutathione lyase